VWLGHRYARRRETRTTRRLRVLTYNVWLGGEDRLGLIADVIRAERPDAVALTEATIEGATALAEVLELECELAPSRHEFPRSHGLHVAWLGAEIRSPVTHALPALAKSMLEIELGGVRLFAAHLASRHEEALHPRAREVDAILGVLNRCHRPHALVGDLNALRRGESIGTPPAGVLPRGDALPDAPRDVLEPLAAAGYVDCFRACGDGAGFTYPSDAPWLRLDYVFASPELAPSLRGAGVVATPESARASDHLPVWAEFALIASDP
jgi:exodeoxyribonuclease-3